MQASREKRAGLEPPGVPVSQAMGRSRPHEAGSTRQAPMCSHQAWHVPCYIS